jgi:hypothetical protein
VYQTQLSVGSVVGAAVDYATHEFPGKKSYQIPLAVMYVAPALQFGLLFFLPETPRWLMTQKRDDDAQASLRKLRNANIDEAELMAEFNEIQQSTHKQMEGRKVNFMEVWRGSTYRRRNLLSIAVICFHAGTGQ